MSRKISISVLLTLLMCLAVSAVYAQDGPRPTPTDISHNQLGNARGFVYLDVNGDGRCVDTGVAGEEPVIGIPVEFMSSDEKHVITHTSGENGAFELAGAGQSNWQVTAKPDSEWIVTSENPRYALVSADNLVAMDVNFCVQKAGTAVMPASDYPVTESEITTDEYVLPEAGAAAPKPNIIIFWPMLLGLSFITLGIIWRWYEIARQ